jgi:hypothetical protein
LSAIDAEEERLMLVPPSKRGSPPAFLEISIAEILKQARLLYWMISRFPTNSTVEMLRWTAAASRRPRMWRADYQVGASSYGRDYEIEQNESNDTSPNELFQSPPSLQHEIAVELLSRGGSTAAWSGNVLAGRGRRVLGSCLHQGKA